MLQCRELGFVCRLVLRFLDRSLAGAMGCFFGCFRVRDDCHLCSRPHLVSQSMRSGAVVSRNQLSCLFLTPERAESPSRDRESPSYGTPRIDKELKNEYTASLLGVAVLFNFLYTLALMYLSPPGKSQAIISQELAEEMDGDQEESKEVPRLRRPPSKRDSFSLSLSSADANNSSR